MITLAPQNTFLSLSLSPGTGHYSQIPAVNGECGPRAFFGRLARWAFGLPVWGVRQPGHAAMTSWSPKGWSVMLGAAWKYCWWESQGGLDFHLDTLSRELRPQYVDLHLIAPAP